MKKCCVVIITHKDKLEGDEERSFLRALDVLCKRDIKLVIPNNISTTYYDKLKEKFNFEFIKVNPQWLESYESYNKMCYNNGFYQLFKNYDYMLIYQTDCWIFEDRLDDFMKLDYDWYGAPWPFYGDKVGNGGFSLRKISKMLEMTEKYNYTGYMHEDGWFCLTHGNELNACDIETACKFAIETPDNRYNKFIEHTPMGLHGTLMKEHWGDKDFWIC